MAQTQSYRLKMQIVPLIIGVILLVALSIEGYAAIESEAYSATFSSE